MTLAGDHLCHTSQAHLRHKSHNRDDSGKGKHYIFFICVEINMKCIAPSAKNQLQIADELFFPHPWTP